MAHNRDLLQQGIDEIRKIYGSAAVFQASDDSVTYRVESISTGSLNIDDATGVGGVPRGRLIMLSGGESSGKSLLALSVIKEAQKRGGLGYYVDAEHTLTVDWMKSLGIDPNGVLVSQADDAEAAFELLMGKPAGRNKSKPVLGVLQNEKILQAGLNNGVIVIDSLSQLVPPIERNAQIGDHTMAAMARFLTPTLRRFVPLLHRTGVTCIVILQMRLDPGQMFGDPRKVSGGQALKHAASVWLDVAKVGGTDIVKDDEPIGHTIKVKVKKNKVGVPFKEAEATIYYVKGINIKSELAAQAIKRGIITHPEDSNTGGGNTWVHPEMGRVVGVNAVTEAISKDAKLAKLLYKQIREHAQGQRDSLEQTMIENEEEFVPPEEAEVVPEHEDIEEQEKVSTETIQEQKSDLTTLRTGLKDKSLAELKDIGSKVDLKGRYTMSKAEIVEALLPLLQEKDIDDGSSG